MDKEVKIIIETTQIADGESHTMKFVQTGCDTPQRLHTETKKEQPMFSAVPFLCDF